MTKRKLKIGIDVGGTFTHAVAVDVARTELVGKAVVPTTHEHADGVAAGVVESMHRLLDEANIAPDEVVLIAHSTTQATNALLEGDVAKVGVLALGSGPHGLRARREARLGDVALGPGATLETAFRYLDVADGVDEVRARALIEELVDEGARAIVAAEPFSVDRPENEETVVRVASDIGVPATATAALTQLYGLRMRTLTATINASMLPIMIETADRTARAVAESGIDAPLMVMRSDGGIMDIEAMRRRPVLTMLSGPAAGVAAALMYERIANGVFVEVGGTSSDICLIRNGRPEIRAAEVGGRRLFVRTLDVRTVGVAGGSLSRLRRGKLADVGPRSAHIAGLEYEAFTAELGDVEVATVRPRPADPDDYVALRRKYGAEATHAVTPTGASTLLGLATGYGRGDEDSARSAFEAVARHVGSTAKDAATRVLELAAARVAPVVKRLLAEHKVTADDMVMIGGGGGAEAVVPFTAKTLGMEHRIARHAEVISAIGVALGILQDTVERTLLSPSESELLAIRREAFDRVRDMGADPETIEVHVEIDRRERRVRATASGSPQLRTRDLAGERPSADELAAAAAKAMKVDEAEALGDGEPWLRAYTAEHRVPILFGLFKVWRMPAAVVDAEGVVRFKTRDAFCESVRAADAEGRLSELVERYTTWGDGGLVIPEVQLVKPNQLVDLSGLVEAAQLLALASAELTPLEPDDGVTLIVVPRS